MGQTTLGLFDADVPAEAARLLWRLWGDESVALSFPHERAMHPFK